MNYEIKDAPVCVHGHPIPYPLLANFPKSRVDVNPCIQDSNPSYPWGLIDFKKLNNIGADLPLLLFVDSFTVSNLKLDAISEIERDVYLFVGDTQHGPHGGFKRLIALARTPQIKRVYFVNNPQHAHWFAQSNKDLNSFYFCPLGLANTEIDSVWESNYCQGKIVHVGNIHPTHKFREFILNSAFECSLPISLVRTQNYMAANDIHRNAAASLNISLNSDLSFRLFEIAISGGRCISDSIGFVQWDNAKFVLQHADIATFSNLDDLIKITDSLSTYHEKFEKKTDRSKLRSEFSLSNLNDLDTLSRYLVDRRMHYWSVPGGSSWQSLDRYLGIRDLCIEKVFPAVELNIDSISSFDLFIYCLDLPRLNIMARCTSEFIVSVENLVDDLKIKDRIVVRLKD